MGELFFSLKREEGVKKYFWGSKIFLILVKIFLVWGQNLYMIGQTKLYLWDQKKTWGVKFDFLRDKNDFRGSELICWVKINFWVLKKYLGGSKNYFCGIKKLLFRGQK